MTPVPFVGLTGGVGAGKSTALAALERLGAATLSTDAVVHELYASDDVRDAVVERFGADVAPNGTVDRAALAQRAFATPEDRAWLEGMLWPRVGARIAAWREQSGARARPARHGCRGAAAVRVRDGGRLRRDHRRGRRRGRARASARPAAGTRPSTSGSRASSRRTRRPQRADHAVGNDGTVDDLDRNCRRPCDAEAHEHATPPVRRRRARAPSRACVARRLPSLLLGGAGRRRRRCCPLREKAVREVTLPLRHEDIIRQQARAKHLDPALIAAVIYAETKFRDRPRRPAPRA